MTADGKGHVATQKERDFVAGLAVFFSMSYAPFVIPVLLPSVSFVAVCLVAALASIGAGLYARVPTAMAPGIALAATVGQFVTAKHIELANALVVCSLAGGVLLLTTWRGLRKGLIDAIPDTIKLALAGGIGALLAENALKLLHAQKSDANVILFVVGICFITAGYIVLRGLAVRSGRFGRFLDICGRSSLFLSVPLITILAYAYYPGTIEKISPGDWFLIKNASLGSFQVKIGDYILLLIFVVWILHADIVGSPYFRELERVRFKTNELTDSSRETIKKSFEAHSIANIFAPAIGAPPVVYYAENVVSHVLGGEGKLVAYVAGACFLAMGVLAMVFFGAAGNEIPLQIPKIAVAPVLFFVGLVIIAKTLADSPSSEQARESPTGEKAAAQEVVSIDTREVLEVWRNIPAAIAIVVTPVAEFDVGVSFAVLSHYLFAWVGLPRKETGGDESSKSPEGDYRGWIAFVLIALALMSLAFRWGSL